jgi:uncharacterized tellurite resistance protein B-like protein
MMARDPLARLARLRRIETEAARRRLGQAAGRADDAKAREAAAGAALTEERAAHAGDYATWLPRGLAERDRAAVARRIAEAALAETRLALGEARAAERAVELLQEARAEAAACRAARRAQALLDEAGLRRRTRG